MGTASVLLLQCLGVPNCTVHFEPEGAVHVLRAEDHFRVECVPPDGEPIEIAYHGDSISVFYAERAINKAGQELKL
jgi:hypothetical protein